MDSDNEWQLLSHYTSEVEARVVESFLKAQGIEVQLLDTQMNAYSPRTTTGGMGMRMMVRQSDLAKACELLEAGQRPTHLEVVGEPVAVGRSPLEKWIVLLLLGVAALTYFLAK